MGEKGVKAGTWVNNGLWVRGFDRGGTEGKGQKRSGAKTWAMIGELKS